MRPKDEYLFGYFGWVVALSVPFWVAGYVISQLPQIPVKLPVSALMAVLPASVAVAFVYRDAGVNGARTLLARAIDYARVPNPVWIFVAIAFMPGVLAGAYLLMRLTGQPLPEPVIALQMLPPFLVVFFIAGVAEELGWQAYAYDRLERRMPALQAALVLGLVWTGWHIIPYFQTGHDALWVFWHSLVTVLLRIVTVWLYVNAGRSAFVAALFHAMCNVGYFLFPNFGSHYDPGATFAVLFTATVVIVLLWGPSSLRRFRLQRAPKQ